MTDSYDKLLFKYSHEMILLVDPITLDIVSASKAVANKLGYTQDELSRMQISDLDTDITAMFFWEDIKSGTENGIVNAQGYFLSSNNMEIPVTKTVTSITDNDRNWLLVYIDDDTEARHNENVLSQLSAQLKATLEATNDGLLVIDQKGRYINMNHRFTDMWLIPQETLNSGKQAIDEWLTDQLTKNSPVQNIHDCLSQSADGDENLTLELKNGNVYELKIQPQLILDKHSGFVLNFHDITEHVRYKEALIKEREKADQANRAKTEFLSNMSHELRTPMNAILGFAQVMQIDLADDDENKENLDEILKAGQHLLNLINEVLDLAKVESGRIELASDNFIINEMITECVIMVSALADQRNIEITFHPTDDVPVTADRHRLRQAMINLLSNAIKYNRQNGTVDITLTAEADHVKIQVRDTGIGIKPEHMKDLFEPFKRLDAEGSDIEGTGIGLTLTRRIIRMMGGALNVKSEVGVGSTFEIILNTHNGVRQADTEEIQMQAQSGLDEVVGSEQYTVLYIEDNLSNIRLVEKLFTRRQNFKLFTCRNALDGIDLAQKTSPDLIFLDISMPVMDGYEVLEKLRSQAQFKTIPIVALSANAMQSDIERGIEAGFDEFLTKPIVISDFYQVIDKLTSNSLIK